MADENTKETTQEPRRNGVNVVGVHAASQLLETIVRLQDFAEQMDGTPGGKLEMNISIYGATGFQQVPIVYEDAEDIISARIRAAVAELQRLGFDRAASEALQGAQKDTEENESSDPGSPGDEPQDPEGIDEPPGFSVCAFYRDEATPTYRWASAYFGDSQQAQDNCDLREFEWSSFELAVKSACRYREMLLEALGVADTPFSRLAIRGELPKQ